MPLIEKDLLHPSAAAEKRKHKKKRLVQNPNSFFMDVKCGGCLNITTVFSHVRHFSLFSPSPSLAPRRAPSVPCDRQLYNPWRGGRG